MPPPVILVAGDDDLLLQRETEQVLSELRRDEPDLDVEVLDVPEVDRLPEMRTGSLFGGTSCVVLRGAERLSGTLREEVATYLEAPAAGAVLVLVARGTGRLRPIVDAVEDVGETREVSLPRDWDDKGWERIVREELERADRSAGPDAVAALREHAGNDAAAIVSKVMQVAAATAAGEEITADDVHGVVEGHGRVSGFAVADAVADRDPQETLITVRGALESGEAPLAVLGSVTYRFRQLVQVRGGVQPPRMSGGQYRRLTGIARGFTPGELGWCVDRLARADLDLKGSDLPPELILEVALLEVATSREVGRPWNPRAERSARHDPAE